MGQVPSSSINDSLGEDSSELGQNVLMIVADDLGVEGVELLHLGASHFSLLDQYEGGGYPPRAEAIKLFLLGFPKDSSSFLPKYHLRQQSHQLYLSANLVIVYVRNRFHFFKLISLVDASSSIFLIGFFIKAILRYFCL